MCVSKDVVELHFRQLQWERSGKSSNKQMNNSYPFRVLALPLKLRRYVVIPITSVSTVARLCSILAQHREHPLISLQPAVSILKLHE